MNTFRIAFASIFVAMAANAADPAHVRIDARIAKTAVGAAADDAEFLRRVTLDLVGRIPTSAELQSFLADKSAVKRTAKIDALLTGADYPKRMTDLFHVMLMERLGDHADWTKYLEASFATNKPWDAMAKEMLRADACDVANRGASFFIAKRLENYGQNPVDYSGLTRDVGRLFLGKNFQCCECHDHLTVDAYKQQHFQGLHAFLRNAILADSKAMLVGEKPTTDKVTFASVFTKVEMMTAPALPGDAMVTIPQFAKGEEFATKPDRKTNDPGVPKFRTLVALSEALPTAKNRDFSRNIVNRVWFAFIGRGLIHPLDLQHAGNPGSHPELLEQLSAEFVAKSFDLKWLIREILLTATYQRSSRGISDAKPERFAIAIERRLTADQLYASSLTATGTKPVDALRAKFLRTFANSPREPEDEVAPTLKAALFLLHDKDILELLRPKPGNLSERLSKIDNPETLANELYVAVLSRMPTNEETATVRDFLAARTGELRGDGIRQLIWALLASTEFGINH